MSIEEKIDELKENLDFFEEELEKYEYIIELGKNQPSLGEEDRVQENLIQGCTSRLWVTIQNDNKKVILDTDGETVIVKGLAKIVQDIFSNQDAKDIINFDTNLLMQLGLTQIITPSRQNGVGNMIKRIKKYAQECIE